MSRALPSGDRGHRNGDSARRQSRSRWVVSGPLGLVCRIAHPHERPTAKAMNHGEEHRDERATVPAIGASGNGPRWLLFERTRPPPRRASTRPKCCAIHLKAHGFVPDGQREPGGDDGPCLWDEQPGAAPPHGRASGGFQREVAVAVGAGAEAKNAAGRRARRRDVTGRQIGSGPSRSSSAPRPRPWWR